MIEAIQHFLGLCPDHSAHLNAVDFAVTGGISTIVIGWRNVLIFAKSIWRKVF